MKLKDMYEDLLLPQGAYYHGTQLDTDEALTPLGESFLVIQWLNSIDSKLPKHIKENRTQWFNERTPSWADIQPTIVENMEALLLECNKKGDDDDEPARIGRFNSSRGRGTGRGGRYNNQTRSDRTQGAQPLNQNKFCEICKHAGKDERVYKSHWVSKCNSLSSAAKQACAKASLRALLADDDSGNSDQDDAQELSEI